MENIKKTFQLNIERYNSFKEKHSLQLVFYLFETFLKYIFVILVAYLLLILDVQLVEQTEFIKAVNLKTLIGISMVYFCPVILYIGLFSRKKVTLHPVLIFLIFNYIIIGKDYDTFWDLNFLIIPLLIVLIIIHALLIFIIKT